MQKSGLVIEMAKPGAVYVSYLIGLVSFLPLSVSHFYSRKLQLCVDKLLVQETFQAVVCTSSSMAEYIFRSTCLEGLKRKPKLLMDFMDLDSDKWLQYSRSANIAKRLVYIREAWLLSKYEVKISRAFDDCFFISQSEVELFVKNKDIDKVPLAIGNGIDTNFFRPHQKPPMNGHPVFIFTGVMDYKPNIDAVTWFAKLVWPQLIEEYDNPRFIIAGMNPVNAITDLVKLKGIEVTGFVEDILPYYHQADIFVAPLTIARGIQNKILQAFSSGIPVVATSLGAEGIECADGEDILIADSPELFISKIEKLIKEPDFYNTIKQNALQLVRDRYSWKSKLEALEKLLI
jgi:sugar transferase (PEP-CTERM/EpsH1 system associated)